MYSNTFTASQGSTVLFSAGGNMQQFVAAPQVYVVAPAVALVLFTLRWHDGAKAWTRALTLSLASLVNLEQDAWGVTVGPGQDVSFDTVLVGGGTYGINIPLASA